MYRMHVQYKFSVTPSPYNFVLNEHFQESLLGESLHLNPFLITPCQTLINLKPHARYAKVTIFKAVKPITWSTLCQPAIPMCPVVLDKLNANLNKRVSFFSTLPVKKYHTITLSLKCKCIFRIDFSTQSEIKFNQFGSTHGYFGTLCLSVIKLAIAQYSSL